MTYQECLDFLYGQLPMFQRDGSSAFKKDLNNTLALCRALGQPQTKFRSIHVAGTNGKGSVCHMIAAVLQAEGYKVGLYTSPHYYDFRERIKINGRFVSKQAVLGFVKRMQATIQTISPSFFELTVAMAFDYFQKQKVDFAVIETGLGGRLDSTNVISPLVSIITNISLDHQSMLGETIALIAGEKAGIIKPGIPVVIGERSAETAPVFENRASELRAALTYAEDHVRLEVVEWGKDDIKVEVEYLPDGQRRRLEVGLTGKYQIANIRTVLASLDILCDTHNLCVSADALAYGLKTVVGSTHLLGRWQKLRENPDVIADSGHNLAGLAVAIDQLKGIENDQLRIVFGVSKDKSYDPMLALLPKNATYYWCAADLPRSLSPDALKLAGEAHCLQGNTYASVSEAITTAISEAGPDDLIYVGGSSFVVGEVLVLSL